MNLPNHFFADAPDAPLTPELIAESCRNLRRHHEKYLNRMPVGTIIARLGEVAAEWRQPDNKFRRLALEHGPAATGFSRATLMRGLDSLFAQFTPENFRALLAQEFGDARRLDGFIAEAHGKKSTMAVAPDLIAHICAGNLPNPAITSMAFGLLLRSVQFVKCARGAEFLPRLFAHSIWETDKQLGAGLEIAVWRGGDAALEDDLFTQVDCVTATGSDETLASIRSRLPVTKRLIGYGHKLSFAFVSSDAFGGGRLRQIIESAAADVTAWDQQGCLSPHVVYVETGGDVTPEKFAERLAEELARRETCEPRGEIPVEEAAAIAARRGIYEIRATHEPETTRHWFSEDSTAWTVVFEADPRFQLSCLNRFIYVKSVKDLAEALQASDAMRGKISTVGIAAGESNTPELAAELARWGVTRICPLGEMQNPPLPWRHDGRPALGDLVTWTDFEL